VSWRDDAACQGLDIDDLFGPWERQADTARKVCAQCPVKMECYEDGRDEVYGLWGGVPEGSPGRKPGGAGPPVRRYAPVCEVEGCSRPHCARGFCNAHYNRLMTWGDVRADEPVGRGDVSVDVETVLVEVAAESGVSVDELLGRSRQKYVVWARQRAMLRLRKGGWSLPAIGRVFGRDHTTVLYGVRKMEDAA
jgi:hypothetical protein